MKIGTPKAILDGENRVAMTPASAIRLQNLGYKCLIERGAGAAAGFSDADYEAVGVEVVKSTVSLWKAASIVAKVCPPNETELKYLTKGKMLTSFLSPAGNEEATGLDKPKNAEVIAMAMVPRIVGCDPVMRFL